MRERCWRAAWVLTATAGLAIAALIAACGGPTIVPAGHETVVPPGGGGGGGTRPGWGGPTTPIRMEKPKLLGPVNPALVLLPGGGTRMAEPNVRVRVSEEEDAPPAVARGKYRGRVVVERLADGKFVAVNLVPMDAYVQGVLAKELYGSWDIETYKAQAVAARTYALYQILAQGSQRLWDVNADESSQMYGGIAGETAKSRAAVAATRGQVLMAAGADGRLGIFCTFYSAATGGATQDPYEAWGDAPVGPLAARRLRPDLERNWEAHQGSATWDPIRITKAEVGRVLAAWAQQNDIGYLKGLGPVARVVVGRRNAATGRPTEIWVTDVRGRTVPLRAEEFRLALVYDPQDRAPHPMSSWFDIVDQGNAIVLTNGRGFGHGIGMSQWGAQTLAEEGKTAAQILGYYYPGSTLVQAWP